MFTPRIDPPPTGRAKPVLDPVAPPGWPDGVPAPGAPGWEDRACRWLLDQAPPEYRSYPVLRRHPAVLARFVVVHLRGCFQAVARGMSAARSDLAGHLAPEVLDEVLAVWEAEQARVAEVGRAASLIEQALSGTRCARPLHQRRPSTGRLRL